MANKTVTLTGTAILAALVVIFDYSMKYSGLKIIFPWLPFLKFDFTGVPILLSFYILGFYSSIFTSAVALFAILARSGDLVGASMKALAEFSTVVGVAFAIKSIPKFKRSVPIIFGVLFRCAVMFFANLLILPLFTSTLFMAVLLQSPPIAVFNIIQGFISVLGGIILKEAVIKKIPAFRK
jgi:riboflavin transporter FmnP